MIAKDVLVESMTSINKNDLMELSQFHGKSCISIYIPTHRAGFETLNGQDSLNLKNQLKETRSKLANDGLNSREIETLINPVLDIVNDSDFWRHQSDGLAIFVSDHFVRKYTIPIKFEMINYLSSEFYIKPLLPLFNDDGLFYLLTLKKDGVRFFEGNKYGISEIDIDDSVPARLEDTVGYDYEEKQLQFRSQMGASRPGTFHGHGESEAKDKNELLLFFREIDRGIMSKLHDFQEPPLVLCCIDYYFPIYRESNTHKNLFPQHVSCNPANFDMRTLHNNAWEILQPYFSQRLHRKKERFLISHDKGKASSNIREIIPAAIHGKVDTLFLEKRSEVYGIYDSTTGGISIYEDHHPPVVSLTNLAAKKVFEQNGTVYLLDQEEMPDPSSDINALFRY